MSRKRITPELRDKWVAALRSGKFIQGRGQLYRNIELLKGEHAVTHCCLGVLCEVDPKVAEAVNREESSKLIDWHSSRGLGEFGRRAAGLADQDEINLASMNDNGTSFDVIANYIETEL